MSSLITKRVTERVVGSDLFRKEIFEAERASGILQSW